jgi:sugar lactone lactonase YvrE
MNRAMFIIPMLLAQLAAAHPGRGIVVQDDGTVLVADAVRSVVWRIDADGDVRAAAREVHAHWLAPAHAGAVLADHVVYAADSGAFLRGLVRIDPDGEVESVIEPAADPTGLDAGAFAIAGELLAIARDSRPVIELRSGADEPRSITLPPHEGDTVSSLLAAPDGVLYAARGRELLRIEVDGSVHRIAEVPRPEGAPIAGLQDLWGLARDADGTLYTADPGARRVLSISVDGSVATVTASPAPWFPTGIAVRDGRLWLLEHGLDGEHNLGPRVRVGPHEGPFELLAEIDE